MTNSIKEYVKASRMNFLRNAAFKIREASVCLAEAVLRNPEKEEINKYKELFADMEKIIEEIDKLAPPLTKFKKTYKDMVVELDILNSYDSLSENNDSD